MTTTKAEEEEEEEEGKDQTSDLRNSPVTII